jgi:hypothetical protein
MPKEANEMIKETMTREERLMTAINLGIPDRVPTEPLIRGFAGKLKGAPMMSIAGSADETVWHSIMQAIHDTYDDLGGWDGHELAGVGLPASSWRLNLVALRDILPGTEGIPKNFGLQFVERETITFEDYDKIISRGWNGFCEEYFPRAMGISLEQLDTHQKRLLEVYMSDAKWWKEQRGVPITVGGGAFSVEMALQLGRTLPKFTLDLHRHPEKVGAALEAMVPDFIQNTLDTCKTTGIPFASIALERSSGTYYNLKLYEKYFFPHLKKMAEAYAAAGIISVMHMDGDWTLNLPYLKDLPKGKMVCEVDGSTDIFKAKEVLNGHMCIMGDVPAPLLALGTPEEVTAYCRKLIYVVGKDGGFILSTGCECPVDAKFENVKAMLETARTYHPHTLRGDNTTKRHIEN